MATQIQEAKQGFKDKQALRAKLEKKDIATSDADNLLASNFQHEFYKMNPGNESRVCDSCGKTKNYVFFRALFSYDCKDCQNKHQ